MTPQHLISLDVAVLSITFRIQYSFPFFVFLLIISLGINQATPMLLSQLPKAGTFNVSSLSSTSSSNTRSNGNIPVREVICSILSCEVNCVMSLYFSTFSINFFFVFGRSSTDEAQKCFRPVNLSSIKSSIAPLSAKTCRAFLFNLE